jgi:hypothetical protein
MLHAKATIPMNYTENTSINLSAFFQIKMEENSEKLSQIVKSETNDIFQSLYEIKESKKEVKFEEIYKDKVIIEEDNDRPNLSSSLVDPNSILINDDKVNLVADVKHILSSAVCSVSKCQQMLSSADDKSEKTFDSIIERLKIIKDDLSKYFFTNVKKKINNLNINHIKLGIFLLR